MTPPAIFCSGDCLVSTAAHCPPFSSNPSMHVTALKFVVLQTSFPERYSIFHDPVFISLGLVTRVPFTIVPGIFSEASAREKVILGLGTPVSVFTLIIKSEFVVPTPGFC